MGNKRLQERRKHQKMQDQMEKIRSTALYSWISEKGRPSAGVSSTPTGPSPGVLDSPLIGPL